MSVKQISVFLENKPGALYAMTGVLAQHKVDMRAFSLAETSDFGIARMIVSDIYAATTILREAGYVHSISEVLAVSVPDVPGGLNKILHVLTDAGLLHPHHQDERSSTAPAISPSAADGKE